MTRLIIFRGLTQLQVSVMETGYSWKIQKACWPFVQLTAALLFPGLVKSWTLK